MLIIRPDQMKAFTESAARIFEDKMVAHSKEFSPRLCAVLGDEQLRVALRSAIKRAEGYGFTYRGPIRLYIELMFLCGSGFDTDPQYSVIGEILNASGDQMERAEQIHKASLDYLESVSGPGNANVRKALEALLHFARRPLTLSGSFAESMLDEMTAIYPQKAAYVGEARLKVLIEKAIAESRKCRFSTVQQGALVVALMFAFGHRCTDDPLYPWIAGTLNDPRIVDPTARAARLERKAITWLEHVLGRDTDHAPI